MQRLVSYNYNGQRQWGVLASDGVSIYSAEDLEETYFIPLGETMEEFIESGEEGLLNLARALEMNAKDKSIEPLSLKDVRLEVPFYPRRNILCVGKNYQAHVKEFDQNANAKNPAVPIFFTKATTSVIGPEEEIDSHPAATKEVDYEGELGVIIGKRCTNVAAEDAMKYVYGYTIINDVTARDLQKKHVQWFKGKSLDTFCPMGPTVMVGDWPVPFTIYTHANGHLRQEGSTKELIFPHPPGLLVLSDGMTLLPGDVIATGTPQGVGMGQNPPQFLKKGDVVEITIDPIGTLKNTVK
ncbi:fumarylacetoacetate hydrolase family protein [Dialister succinatiphilus]|uniref:fumarylacetoacetate hydrolase family protein n=1 Tax=Dialister succinatiphilus TaxID=487173 RepID=UPI0040277E24